MYKWLKPESKFAQNAGVFSNIPRLVGSVVAWSDDPVVSTGLALSTVVGFGWGQTQTGRVTQYSLGFVGYSAMAVNALKHIGEPSGQAQLLAATGSLMSMSRMMIDEYKGSKYETFFSSFIQPKSDKKQKQGSVKKDASMSLGRQAYEFFTGLPKRGVQKIAQRCAASSNATMSQFGSDLVEITQRRGFASASFGTFCNTIYGASGLIAGDTTKVFSASQWGLANVMSAVAVSKDGQKNILKQWASDAWDKVVHSNNHNNRSQPPEKPQVA